MKNSRYLLADSNVEYSFWVQGRRGFAPCDHQTRFKYKPKHRLRHANSDKFNNAVLRRVQQPRACTHMCGDCVIVNDFNENERHRRDRIKSRYTNVN